MDDDYAGDDQTLLWSKSKSKITGSMMDAVAGIGWKAGNTFTPMVGGFYSRKSLKMKNPIQTASSAGNNETFIAKQTLFSGLIPPPPVLGAVTQTTAPTYTIDIFGPWVGGEMDLKLSNSFHILGELRTLYFWYKAEGKWPLFNYKDDAKGYGFVGSIGIEYPFTPKASMTAKIGGSYLKIDNGKYRQENATLPKFHGLVKNLSVSLGAHIKL